MTPLRKKMLEELCRHNYAPRTQQSYVAQIAKLARHFGTSPDQLTREQVQQYQDWLTDQQVSWLPQAIAAMQFFYNKTLDRNWKIVHSYRSKKPKQDPVVLTLEEVAQLLAAAQPLKAKMLFTTMYGCGLRVSEAIRLQVTDVDSQRMVLHIRQIGLPQAGPSSWRTYLHRTLAITGFALRVQALALATVSEGLGGLRQTSLERA